MNKVFVYGRVSTDVEIKDMNGRNVANFNVASQNKNIINKEERKYGTNFYRVSVWGPSADAAAKYLRKGNRVVVAGDLVVREYTGSDQLKHTSLEINNAEFDLVETKAESGASGQAATVPAPAATSNGIPAGVIDDSLPF